MFLLNTQRNELFGVLVSHGLNANDFKEYDLKGHYQIRPKSRADLYFDAQPTVGNGHWVLARPGVDNMPSESSRTSCDYWGRLVADFSIWAERLKEEIGALDLWAEAAKTAHLFAPTAEPSDDKFTRTELAEVQGQLRLLQLSFTASALPEAAKQKLIELTQTAAVKAEGLTKKDWQNWIIGGFIGAITNLAFNPTQAGEVLKLVKAAFGGLFLH